MKKISIILTIFFIDRIIKIYLINLQGEGTEIDFYIFSFLNIYLVWNTGIGFGLIPLEADLFYHLLTSLIILINIVLIYFLIKTKGFYIYLIEFIIMQYQILLTFTWVIFIGSYLILLIYL